MIYPSFIKPGGTIGITAISAGQGDKPEVFSNTLNHLKSLGYNILCTANVWLNNNPSCKASVRVKEFESLLFDENVDFIMAASGGDFTFEMLPKLKLEKIKDHVKWILGASDPTNILFIITTKYDIATMYGYNASSFKPNFIEQGELNCLDFIKGNLKSQKSFQKYQVGYPEDKHHFTKNVKWQSNKKEIEVSGRLIGGCLDCLNEIIGTKYDATLDFINRYKEDGIIWYFDIYGLSCDDVYRMLWKMKQLNYFKYTKLVLFSRLIFPKTDYCVLNYRQAYKKGLGNIDFIYDMDIGHSAPCFTLINGTILDIKYKDNKGEIDFKLL